MRPSALLALVPAVALAAAAPASASTYCVADPACPVGGVAQPSVEAAVDAANAAAGADTVSVGPGRFVLGGPVGTFPDTTLAGAGAAATTLVGQVEQYNRGAVLRGLTVELAAGQRRGVIARGTVSDTDIVGPAGVAADAVGLAGAKNARFERGTIRMAAGTGVIDDDLGGATVVDSVVEAPVGAHSHDSAVTFVRTRIRANVGVLAESSRANLDAVLIDLDGAGATGVRGGPGDIAVRELSLRHVTVRGTGEPGQTGLALVGGCPLRSAALTADTTALTGVATAISRVSECASEPAGRASLRITRSAFDPAAVVSSGPGTVAIEPPVSTTVALDADGVPSAGSALLDAGDPAETAGTDLRGLPRPADGDADGTAVADVGAFERQPSAASPGEPIVRQPVAELAAPAPGGGVLGVSQARVAPTALNVRPVPFTARPGLYAVRARLAFPAGTNPAGGVATLRVFGGKRRIGSHSEPMTSAGQVEFKLRVPRRARKSVRVQVRFRGTETLAPLTSRKVRLP